jgi:hypothetical protein
MRVCKNTHWIFDLEEMEAALLRELLSLLAEQKVALSREQERLRETLCLELAGVGR